MNRTICKHLRTKKMYVESTPEEALADPQGLEASTCHFWCNLTQSVVGPDDQQAHKTSCHPARKCFEE